MEKSRAFTVYMAIKRIVIARVIFMARKKSRSIEGNGIIITTRIVTTPMTVIISLAEANLDLDSVIFSMLFSVFHI
jgi:hypothetical protein